jgi:glucose/arabinose dehydrogenase
MKTSGWVKHALLIGVFAWTCAGCGGGGGGGGTEATVQPPPPTPALAPFVSGFLSPVGIETPNDGSNRLFVVEQGGTIRIIENGLRLDTPFLDITGRVTSGGETGLLGLAFHPNFAVNGRFFVHYTRGTISNLEIVISEFSLLNVRQANPASERILLVVSHPNFANHNGGQLSFGPDGFLYIGLGDGGGAGDLAGNGQNLQTLLGKILRIDVDGPLVNGKQYAIPPDNPFVISGLPEIWAYGLRNPWRFSFDVPTGRLFAGDVGQDSFEEVDLITRGGNFGWNIMEGTHCFPPGATCVSTGLISPVTEYAHDAAGGTSVIGGFFYRGSALPGLVGAYVFGDLSSGNVWSLRQDIQGNWQRTLILTHTLTVSAFGRNALGELYVVDYLNGAILRIATAP